MAYSEEVKNEAKEMLAKGKKVKQVSEEMKISVATIYKWKKEVEEKNVEKIEERYLKSQSNKPTQDAIDTSKEIKKLIGLKRFNEAMRLTEKYLENPVIQSQRVKILIINRKYQEAKRIGRREEFINDAIIQSQMITIAIEEGDLEEAKRIGRREEFINNVPIQSQMVTIAIKEGDLETRIIETMEPIKYEMFEEKASTLNSEILNQIVTKLYYNKIEQKDIEEIMNQTGISEFERTTMLLAIYEKQKNISKAKQLVKNYRAEDNQLEHKKIFNKIIQRIQSKKTQIFDYKFYDDLLHWKIDKELKEKFEQEQKSEIEKRDKSKKENLKPNTIIFAEKSENNQAEIKTQTGGDYKRTEGNKKSFKESIKVKQDNIIVQKKEKKELYFSQISNFLKEKRHLIYLKMQSTNPQIQRTGIEQWDKMEALIEKVNENKDNKDYLNILYQKISELKEKENRMSSR